MPSQFLISSEKSRKRCSTASDHSSRWHPRRIRRKIGQYSNTFRAKLSLTSKEEEEYQSMTSTNRHVRDVGCTLPKRDDFDYEEDGEDDTRIKVSKKTLEMMETEAAQLTYPTTLFRLGQALESSAPVLFDHCHPIEEESGGDSSQNLSIILQNLNVRNSKMKQIWGRNSDEVQLKRALHELVKQDGSLDLKIHNWDEAMKHLSAVLILPQSYIQEEEVEEEFDGEEGHLEVRQTRPKFKPSTKLVPFKGGRSSPAHNLSRRKPKMTVSSRRRLKTSGNVQDYYKKIMKTLRRSKGRGIWNARSVWLQNKHVTPPPRVVQKINNENGEEVGEKYENKIDPLVSLRDEVFKTKIGEAERVARSKEIQEIERIKIDICRREKEEEEEEEKARAKASSILRPLTEEEESIVEQAIFSIGPSDDILARCNTDSVQRRSMQCLQPGKWLNDEVIHYFYLMLSNRDAQLSEADVNHKRSHFFKSFFLTKLFDEGASNTYKYSNVKRWSKKVPGKDIFALDKIFCPCNLSNVHWACAIIYIQEKKIQFYDSMTGDGMYHMKGLLSYLKDEWKAKKGGDLPDADSWRLISCTPETPVQENGFDCGVFTCMFADFISMDRSLVFSQEHITQCRKRIALSIMNGTASD